jgi:hypothetical protein
MEIPRDGYQLNKKCGNSSDYNRVQKLLRQAVYWPSPSCNNGSCPPPPCAMLLKRFWGQGLSNNMLSTLLMGGGGPKCEESHYFCTRFNRVQKLLRQAVYWPSPSYNNGSCPPPPCAMLLKRFWGQGLSNNMLSTLLMGGGGHAREKDHQNVKSLIIFARDCRSKTIGGISKGWVEIH